MKPKKRLIAQVLGSIEWRLRIGGPSEFPLDEFPGWSLLNPLAWTSAECRLVSMKVSGRLGQDVLLWSQGLCFVFQGEHVPESIPSEFITISAQVVKRLRYASRQFSVPRRILSYVDPKSDSSDQWDVGAVVEIPKGLRIRNYVIPTAVTERHVQQVAKMDALSPVPLHAEVLLDALEGQVEEDYRKALLYAAIAVEVFVHERLEEAYHQNLTQLSSRHRAIRFPLAGGRETIKDPVYELLIQSDNFPRCLHEIPLYVLGRSFLDERKSEYQSALRLYTTRNKIAHQGAPPSDEKYFPLTYQGATDGLRSAISTLAWFGDPGPYFVWEIDLVSAHEPHASIA